MQNDTAQARIEELEAAVQQYRESGCVYVQTAVTLKNKLDAAHQKIAALQKRLANPSLCSN